MPDTLALCMIVKNEEEYLPYVLGSVYKYCDEIVVVDTGSTDRTMEIAKAFGAYVIQAPWVNDFALVRNISQSCATSDWILWLDGDEIFTDMGIRKIKQRLIQDDTADFFLCPRINFWKDIYHMNWYPDSQYKVYRNNEGYKWQRPIHEIIYDESNSKHRRGLRNCDVHIFHYAYMKSVEEVKNKMKLYIKIENPNMDDMKIDRCSTEHSFFFNKTDNTVQPYNGPMPEVFDNLIVDENGIRWNSGEVVLNYNDVPKRSETIVIPSNPPQPPPVENNIPTSNSENLFANDEVVSGLSSIVIATHNKVEYLEPCMHSIFDSTHIPFELIIVDNGSTESNVVNFLEAEVRHHGNLKYYRSSENLGFAGGYNFGTQFAVGEWICVLNNDTLVTSGWLEKMVKGLSDNPQFAIIAPVSNNIHGEHQFIEAPAGSSFGDYLTIVNQRVVGIPNTVVESSWITGCCMVFNRNLIYDLAKISDPPRNGILFCEDFKVGQGEDTDLDFYVHHRLHKKLGVALDTFIWHHGQKTLESCTESWEELQRRNDQVLRARWPEIFPNG